MHHLQANDLLSLEEYHRQRPEFRSRIMAHKKLRQVAVGPNATLYFEDRLTIQYQVQEMLRIERIFESDGIADELNAYNPLIPDGTNLKATFMLEYPDAAERKTELARLIGVETKVWMAVAGCARVYAIADEDLERATEEKTSSVHFLRFEFDPEMLGALKGGAALSAGIDHDNYRYSVEPLDADVRAALVADLD
ncbi:MAG: DUF3501 family protein [Chromatiales bacterium]|jgi:hypothetical protein